MPNAQKNDQKQGVSPIIAGAVGAVAGAGVVAAAAALRDKKTRQQAQKVLNTVKDQAKEYADEAITKAKKDPRVKEAVRNVEKQLDKGVL
ncbi:hypothetical protein H3C66_02080 [Patescibacteria group bacterium]|nr:hypothetical protein [Patescibacteria group bacterium]